MDEQAVSPQPGTLVVQKDVKGAVAHSTDVDVHTGVFEEEHGEAKEGLSTKVADGDTRLAFDIDDRFTAATDPGSEVAIK